MKVLYVMFSILVLFGLRDTDPHISGSYKICNTCATKIIVSHDECTECMDLHIDSGTVILTESTAAKWDSIRPSIKEHKNKIGTQHHLRTEDLYIENKEIFKKLWPVKRNKEGDEYYDFNKMYWLEGYVTDVKQRVLDNGVTEPEWALFFHITKYTVLTKAEAQKNRNSRR